MFNTNRRQFATAVDGTVDPYQTIWTNFDKDPGHPNHNKRCSIDQALKSNSFYDSKGNVMNKVDKNHGMRNGGTLYHHTHGRPDHTKLPIRAETCPETEN